MAETRDNGYVYDKLLKKCRIGYSTHCANNTDNTDANKARRHKALNDNANAKILALKPRTLALRQRRGS